MSFFDRFKKKAEEVAGGVWRQINPFDGGATYSNPNPQQAPQQAPQGQAYGQAPRGQGSAFVGAQQPTYINQNQVRQLLGNTNYGLQNIVKNIKPPQLHVNLPSPVQSGVNQIRDVFDANTAMDQQKRLQQGGPQIVRTIQDEYRNPTNPVNSVLKTANQVVSSPFKPVVNTNLAAIDLMKAGAGQLTGNQTAKNNAINAFKNTNNDTLNIARDMFVRPVAQLGGTVKGLAQAPFGGPIAESYTPQNKVEKFLVGDRPVQNVFAGTKDNYETHPNLPTPIRGALAGLYGLGQVANMIPATAPAGKAAKPLIGNAAKEVKNMTKSGAIDDLAKIAQNRTPLNQSGSIPNPLSDLNDGQLMERNYIHNLQAIQGEGAQLPKQTFRDKLTNSAIDTTPRPATNENLYGSRPLQKIGDKVNKLLGVDNQGGGIPNPSYDPLEALKAEARKYKSADEFIKAQGDSFYHTTPAKFDKFDKKYLGTNTDFDNARSGFYFTDNMEQIDDFKNVLKDGFGGGFITEGRKKTAAELANYRTIEKIAKKENFYNFNYNAKDLTPKEARLFAEFADKKMGGLMDLDGQPVNAKNMSDKELGDFLKENVFVDDLDPDSSFIPYFTDNYLDDFTKFVESKGYKGMITDYAQGKNEYLVFDPNALQTKQELTDLYNEATKKKGFFKPMNQGGYVKVPGKGEPIDKTPTTGTAAPINKTPKLAPEETLADYNVTNIRNNKDFVNAVNKVAKSTGEDINTAKARVEMLLEKARKNTVSNEQIYKSTSGPEEVKNVFIGRNDKFKEVTKGLSRANGQSEVEANQAAALIDSRLKELGLKNKDFIEKYQAGTLDTPAEKEMGNLVKSITDKIFIKEQKLRDDIKYRKNYIPQSYKQSEQEVNDAINRLQTNTGAANPRKFNSYKEAAGYGLNPEYDTLGQMIGTSAARAEKALQNRDVINKGLKSGLFTTNNNGSPVMGLETINGEQIYASKRVADTLNGALQRNSGLLNKALEKTAKAFGTVQDVMLQGGIPGTNANFFVTGQAVKDTTRNIGKAIAHPIQAIKQETHLVSDLVRGKKATQERFTTGTFNAKGKTIKNSDFVKELADNGLYLKPQTTMNSIGRNKLSKAWSTLGNNPTFGRYMPNRNLSTAQEVYTQTVKRLGHEKAVKLAAETVKRYMGIVDELAMGRSYTTKDIMGATLFAPKYRESIINSLNNAARSIVDPRTYRDKAFAPSRQLVFGMAVTLAGYELLNRKLTGHSMTENREGQQLSLQIPYGEKDEKGNQKVVNIPFMPGYMTIPRALVGAASAAAKGDIKGVINKGSIALAAPLQTAGDLISNQDYWGNPIYMDKKSAAQYGQEPDNPIDAAKKLAGYTAGQFSPAWVRGAAMKIQGKPTEQAIATALEAPIKFGKQLNPETTAYFNDREEIYGTLNKNDQAVWDTIHPPIKKNKKGEYIVEKSVDSGLQRAANYLANPKVLEAENELARRAVARGQKVDPLFMLDNQSQRIALRIETLPPKDPQKKVLIMDNASWYNNFQKARSDFFDTLPPGDPNKPKSPIAYPERPKNIEGLMDQYSKIDDPAKKHQMITDHPEIADQFAKEEKYARDVRAAKNLPQYDKYPEANPEVKKLIDEYYALPQGNGPISRTTGKATSPDRSAWIRNHPNEWAKMTEQFNKQSLFNLQEDMKVAAFEGHDPTDKGIKAIASLGRDINGTGYGSGGYTRYAKKNKGYSGARIAKGSKKSKSTMVSITKKSTPKSFTSSKVKFTPTQKPKLSKSKTIKPVAKMPKIT